MKGVFVDTAGWVACADAADTVHTRAKAARDAALEQGQPLVTTDYVVDETLTVLRLRLGLRAAESWWRQIDASSRLRWERISVERFDRARTLFFQFRDKNFSFTDCSSFVVMQELRLRQALTTDRHFEHMGFETLPGSRARPRRSR
jgi:uncharacterized protein